MDLEGESSALESVGDNGLIHESSVNIAHEGRSLDNGSCSDESVKLVSTSRVNFDSPGGACSPVSKGQGLRKWRRIRRDLIKDTPANVENSKALKRGLSGFAYSHGKQMQFQSPEVEQDTQGSVGSVNMLNISGDGFEILGTVHDPRFMAGIGFSAGIDSEKDDDRSSKTSTSARVPKVIRYEKAMISSGKRDNIKKHRGKMVEMEKEKSHSSLENDSRKQSRRLMDYNGDEANMMMNGETSKRKDDVGGEGQDQLAEAIYGFLTLQEALEKEVQQFQEIGKDSMAQHHEGASEVSSSHTEIATLVNNVEQLEIKLEEKGSMLEVKESYILELETTNQNTSYLTGEEVETKAADLANRTQELDNECIEATGTIKKKACKNTSYFLIQLVSLLTVGLLFISQLFPDSDTVVPT